MANCLFLESVDKRQAGYEQGVVAGYKGLTINQFVCWFARRSHYSSIERPC